MGNKAQMELQGLLDMQATAESDMTNSAKMLDDYKEGRATEAEFALPEAMATAIGASFVLGPAGILLGVAQGLLGKKEQQNAIDAYMDTNDALGASSQVIIDSITEAELLAEGQPDNLAQLSAIRDTVMMGQEMLGSPYTMEGAAEFFNKADTAFNQYNIDNETQNNLERVRVAQQKREMDQETYSRHRTLVGDFNNESANFEAQVMAADNVVEALNRGDGAAIAGALATMPLLINPDAGATSEGEVAIWAGVGGMLDGLQGTIEKELGSGGLTDGSRKKIMEVALQYKRNAISLQQSREAFYGRSAVVEGVPEKYWREYNRTSMMPDIAGKGFISQGSAAEQAAISMAINDTVDTLAGIPDLIGTDNRTPEQKAADLQQHGRPGRD